jgi:hypothetical protein
LPTFIDHAMIASWDATQTSQQYRAFSQPMGRKPLSHRRQQ